VDGAKGLVRSASGGVEVALVAEVDEEALLVHDAHQEDPSTAFAISRLTSADYLHQAPIGIFRQVERPTYDDQARAQVTAASAAAPGDRTDKLGALIGGGDTWTVV
jgi:2-oxoglutarate ferredoxin oxidoreductase subunit beta